MKWFATIALVISVGLAQDEYERETCLQARWNAGYDLHSKAACETTLDATQKEAYLEYTLSRTATLTAEHGETYVLYEAWLAAKNAESKTAF
jgi:hypothetical protein